MKDIGKELGDAVVISLGFIVIEITVFLSVALIMRAIYCCPPEERGAASFHSQPHGHGNTVQLIANPVRKWHPLNVSHGF